MTVTEELYDNDDEMSSWIV